jgi:hypothetical protein
MKRKVTMELTVEQAAKVYDLIGFGFWDAEQGELYDQSGEACAVRAVNIVRESLMRSFGERLHDTP